MPFALNTGDMMQALKKAVLTARKKLSGNIPYLEDYLENSATSGPIPGKSFVVGEKTSALLLLCLEVDMFVERLYEVVDESEIDTFEEVVVDLKDSIHREMISHIAYQLALVDNIRKDEIEI